MTANSFFSCATMLGGVFALPMTDTRRPPANLPDADGADNDDDDGLDASPAIAAAASMIALASSTHEVNDKEECSSSSGY